MTDKFTLLRSSTTKDAALPKKQQADLPALIALPFPLTSHQANPTLPMVALPFE
jgi:hypothetical protein